jgi:sterol desaturase/sphingolipid hydroxylase (fatty acid hydroxylase superfamily)
MTWTRPLLALSILAALMFLESAFALRARRSQRSVRWMRNIVLGGLAFVVIAFIQAPALESLARAHPTFAWTSAARAPWMRTLASVLAFLLLDYTLWFWHRLNHRVPFLWRFHLVHHIDRDLDATTGLRFHCGEIALSIGFRALQLALIGGDLALLGAWQSAVFASVIFHHSNVRLPARVDRWLTALLVTPRMHGIHHSEVRAETDSNWSSLLTVWDRLHGTLTLDVPEQRIVIGVPAWDDERDVTLPRILTMPFVEQRADWEPRERALTS